MQNVKTSLIILSMFGTMACASASPDGNNTSGIDALKDDVRLGAKVEKICFNRNIDGFSNATKDTVVLSSGVKDDYVVEVRGVCQNLSFAQSIGIDSSLSCVRRGDYLIVSDSAFGHGGGLGPDRCFIDKIYKWDKTATSAKTDPDDE